MLSNTYTACYIQYYITHDSKEHNILYITTACLYSLERHLHNMLYLMFNDMLYCRWILQDNIKYNKTYKCGM